MKQPIIEDDIYEIVYSAIDEYNEMQEEDEHIYKEPSALLMKDGDQGGPLDTDEAVNFLICIDELLDNDQRTVSINFDMNKILEDKKIILRNVESLVKHIYNLSQK